MYIKLIACVAILCGLIQESVQDGNCPDCPVCRAPTAEASITSTFAGSFSKARQKRQATRSINLESDSNAPTTRGSTFALAFMRNLFSPAPEITLYITTEQNVSYFTIKTRYSGLTGFNEASLDSGLYSRTGTAQKGEFTVIQLQAGADFNEPPGPPDFTGPPDLSVGSDLMNDDEVDRPKGLILTADNQNDELTVYALNSNIDNTAGAFMAINCVGFPTARDYQYFVLSSEYFGSQFLMTPCQDNTTIRVRPSQPYTHPSWVNPSVQRTTPGTLSEEEAIYGRRFNRFDTLLLSSDDDLTGTIITSNKPLSVFSGFMYINNFVEQIPPHPTYGDVFFLAPFELFTSNHFRIGSVSDEVSIQVNCPCERGSVSNNRVPLSGSGVFFTAVINRGQYVECRTPYNSHAFCSVQSTRPVTVMSYSMVYIPPVDSYLTQYSFISLLGDSLSYTLQELNIDQELLVNGDVLTPSDGFTTINCRFDCFESMVCGQGATGFFGQGTFDIQFSDDVSFWGYVHGNIGSFAHPLPFKMIPIGLAWIQAQDLVVMETMGLVVMEFMITKGDRSVITRAFAVTRNFSATAGKDFNSTGLFRGTGNSNLEWRIGNSAPNVQFIVPIIDDDIPEPVEVLEIVVECEDYGNCYLPRRSYTITIIDDQAVCFDLPQIEMEIGTLEYNMEEDMISGTRPNGTVATYTCINGFKLDGDADRICDTGNWTGTVPVCIEIFCSDLLQIDYGTLSFIGFPLNATKPNGTVATYICDDGFNLNGDATRICFDGYWTGTEPVCTTNPTMSTIQPTNQGGGVSDPVIISIVVVVVVAAHAILAIICCLCFLRLRQNKQERLRIMSTIRMRRLSDRSSTLKDYQMREIIKYVPESMRIPSSNLKLQDAVGQGAFGIVYKGLLMDWNNVAIRGVALKTLKGLFTQSDVQSMVSEITKMQEFHHPHVMPLIGVCLDAGPGVSMVMPYMTNGSLLDYLKKERSALELAEGEDSEKVLAVRKLLLKMCHQIALGMAYLARHKFVHRDLAARNCMLDSNGDVKVGDFGLAEDTYAQGYFRQGEAEGVKLPYKWLAMESLNDAIFNEKTDVWSYGVTVWEVFSSGRTPYPGVDPMSLVALLREGKRLEPPQNIACSTDMISLMTTCWYEDSDERPSFDELAAELEKVLSTMVGYVELNMELVPITEDEHSHAASEEVAIETNAAYGLRNEDRLQAEQVTTETNLAYGIGRKQELQENPAEQVTDSAHHFDSDPQQSPLPEHDHEGYSDYRDTTGYAKVLHRRSSHETS
ncbi:uncharacterized protein LOC135334578 isoform X3 [Halichondria panicea]|uniref:uncharacterized protein LOC135334578 isoform X3 n=2 Tax=Halichondria panicea TaxID=6063 RepID=UPI00312B85F5